MEQVKLLGGSVEFGVNRLSLSETKSTVLYKTHYFKVMMVKVFVQQSLGLARGPGATSGPADRLNWPLR